MGRGSEGFWVTGLRGSTGLRRKSRRKSIGKSGLTNRVTSCIRFSLPGSMGFGFPWVLGSTSSPEIATRTTRKLAKNRTWRIGHRSFTGVIHRRIGLRSLFRSLSLLLSLLLGLSHTFNLSVSLEQKNEEEEMKKKEEKEKKKMKWRCNRGYAGEEEKKEKRKKKRKNGIR